MSMSGGCWDGFHRLGVSQSTAPDAPGVYAVYWADEAGSPLAIARAKDSDDCGTLYIGSAGSLRRHITRYYCTTKEHPPPKGKCFACNYRYYRADRKWKPYAPAWLTGSAGKV